MTGFIRKFLLNHFSNPNNIEHPQLADYLWNPTDGSAIMIESIFRWRPAMANKRPAILIKPNKMQNLKLGIDNFIGTDRRGFANFQTFWIGSHTLFCLDGQGAAAEILGAEVSRALGQNGPSFKLQCGLYAFNVSSLDDIFEVDEARENWSCPVVVAWAFDEKWSLREVSLPLRHIDGDLSASAG